MRLLASELVKVRTVRTSFVLLLGTVLISAAAVAGFVGSGSVDRVEEDPALRLAQAASFGNLFVAVVGILIVTNEYRHGTIMTTFLAEPHRVRVLVAKLTAAGIVGLTFAVAAIAVSAAVALPWLSARGESLLLDGQALEAVGRVLLAFALTAIFGAAVGAIVQSQVGAIVGWFMWILVFESLVTVIAGLVFTDVGEPDPVSKFLPGSSLGGIVGGEGNEFLLNGGGAAVLAIAYAIGLSALGALSMTRRDP